jgi:hypothetical protein
MTPIVFRMGMPWQLTPASYGGVDWVELGFSGCIRCAFLSLAAAKVDYVGVG